jgi:hypothetical protein
MHADYLATGEAELKDGSVNMIQTRSAILTIVGDGDTRCIYRDSAIDI